MLFLHSQKADNGNDSNFESSEISTILRLMQLKNAHLDNIDTFAGIIKFLIFESENAYSPISETVDGI